MTKVWDELLRRVQSWPETAQHELAQVVPSLERRIEAAITRIGQWPESARQVAQRPGIRVVPLIRYPYRIFYRISDDKIEILHIHHAARDE
jgi:toxin ParE1/3/4